MLEFCEIIAKKEEAWSLAQKNNGHDGNQQIRDESQDIYSQCERALAGKTQLESYALAKKIARDNLYGYFDSQANDRINTERLSLELKTKKTIYDSYVIDGAEKYLRELTNSEFNNLKQLAIQELKK